MVLNLPNGTVVKYQLGSTVNGWGYVEYTNSKVDIPRVCECLLYQKR